MSLPPLRFLWWCRNTASTVLNPVYNVSLTSFMSHVKHLPPRSTVILSIKCVAKVLKPFVEAYIRISSHKGGDKSAQPAGGTETWHHKKQSRLEGGKWGGGSELQEKQKRHLALGCSSLGLRLCARKVVSYLLGSDFLCLTAGNLLYYRTSINKRKGKELSMSTCEAVQVTT